MFGISGLKLIIIMAAGLILIGPDKMPEIARTIGKALKMFNAAKDEMEQLIKADMFTNETPGSTLTGSAAASGTVASTLYADDEEEEEEEE